MQPSVLRYVKGPCGNIAEFDYSSAIGYRCTTCGAVLGSIGMPKECRDLQEQEELLETLSDTH